MRKGPTRAIVLSVLLLVPLLVEARGGGGIEYTTSMGSDILGSFALSNGSLLVLPTGAAQGISGFGYGITQDGWKIGGFGTFFYTEPISVQVGTMTVRNAIGGVGGVISGGHGRLGPFTLALNARLGAGGMAVDNSVTGSARWWWTGTFALYGALDAEIGVVFVPAMMVSAYAGVSAFLMAPYPIVPIAVPTMGIRITWGRF